MGSIPYLPPTKWVPVKCFTSGFGAVRLIKVAGINLAPGPVSGGPSSILHEEGASTERTGTLVFSMAAITSLKGSRTSPEKLKPEKYEREINSQTCIIYRILHLQHDSRSLESSRNPQ